MAGRLRLAVEQGRWRTISPSLWAGVALTAAGKRLDQEGVTIDPQTATPAWQGKRVDVDWAGGLL